MVISLISCSNASNATENVKEAPLPTETNSAHPLTFDISDSEIPLAEPGPYEFSMIREIVYNDEERGGREISISIYYPSIDDQPNLRGAPFPLIINDHKMFNKFGTHLASYGFIVAGINGIDTYRPWDQNLYNQPLDYISVLNQLAHNPPEFLAGIIDSDHVGVWGYSFGGRNAVVLSGGRIDQEYYFENCENPGEATIKLTGSELSKVCAPYENWDTFVDQAGREITESEDGLWQPITDDRIIALMPLSPGSEWLFGPRGFASSDKAVLLTVGTLEDPLYQETYKIFEELGTSEKIFISFVGKGHGMIFESDAPKKMQHLAIAFFSYHLKGYEEYSHYFSEEYISQIDGLAWGWYEE